VPRCAELLERLPRARGPPSSSTRRRRSATRPGPVIKKYTGVLAAADVYTASTTFVILESIRLDLGVDSQIHP
jgi:hypothetical protein